MKSLEKQRAVHLNGLLLKFHLAHSNQPEADDSYRPDQYDETLGGLKDPFLRWGSSSPFPRTPLINNQEGSHSLGVGLQCRELGGCYE